MVFSEDKPTAKMFRGLSIDELIDTVDIAINVLENKYEKIIKSGSVDKTLYYKDRILYLAYLILSMI